MTELETLLQEMQVKESICKGPCKDCEPKQKIRKLIAALRAALPYLDVNMDARYWRTK